MKNDCIVHRKNQSITVKSSDLDLSLQEIIDIFDYHLMNDFRNKFLTKDNQNIKNIYYTVKQNKNEFGYYISDHRKVINIIKIMKHYNLKSILDLGCGVGHFLSYLKFASKALYYPIETYGIENERCLIDLSLKTLPYSLRLNNIIHGDILKDEWPKSDAIYFWEPIISDKETRYGGENIRRFVELLNKSTENGVKIIFYKVDCQFTNRYINSNIIMKNFKIFSAYQKNISQKHKIFHTGERILINNELLK